MGKGHFVKHTDYCKDPDCPMCKSKPAQPKRHWLPYDRWMKYQERNNRCKKESGRPGMPPGYPCSDPKDCPVCGEYHKWSTRREGFEPKQAPGLGICDFHHCRVCKKLVANEPHGGFCGNPACKICDDFMMLRKKPEGSFLKPLEGPVTSAHYTGIITDDLEEGSKLITPELYQKWIDHNKSKKEVNMCEDQTQDFELQNLYEVITTYGGDRENVVVERTEVVAESENRALMQAKDAINSSWDMDYVDQNVNMICQVRVKRKPREILKG